VVADDARRGVMVLTAMTPVVTADTRRGVSPGSAPGLLWRVAVLLRRRPGPTGQDDRGARRSLRRASSSSPTRVSIGWPGTPIIVTTKRLRMSARLLPSW
jgi:hypothetical protein